MSGFLDIYYALWANLSAWPLLTRAAISVFVALFVLWIVGWALFVRFFGLSRHLLNWLVMGICALGVTILVPLRWIAPHRYLRLCNGLLDTLGRHSRSLLQKSGKTKFGFKRMLFLYALCLGLIALPDFLGASVSAEYRERLYMPRILYHKAESFALKASASYEPLFPDLMPKVMLRPSEEGRKFGVRIHEHPETVSQELVNVTDRNVRYLWKRSGDWLYVQDGSATGWVHGSLLERPPERAQA